jgi:hypothetical protein
MFDPCRLVRQVKVVAGSRWGKGFSFLSHPPLFDPCRLVRQVKVVAG